MLRDIEADDAATRHKGKFFEQGATLSTVVTLDKDVTPAQYEEFVAVQGSDGWRRPGIQDPVSAAARDVTINPRTCSSSTSKSPGRWR